MQASDDKARRAHPRRPHPEAPSPPAAGADAAAAAACGGGWVGWVNPQDVWIPQIEVSLKILDTPHRT